MIFDWKPYEKELDSAWKEYQDMWKVWDNTLYELCKNNYHHKEKNVIAAKLALISRSYLSGLERHTKGNLSDIIKFFYKRRRGIESIFKRLRKIKGSLNEDKIVKIISEHGKFVNILKDFTNKEKTVRSFASKYMHFHCKVVPIYDNVTSSVISQNDFYPLTNRDINRFKKPKEGDEIYYKYCLRFFAMYNDLMESGFEFEVKRIDHYLLWCKYNEQIP